MTPETRDWLAGLRDAVGRVRPSATSGAADAAEMAAERMILAADLSAWIDAAPGLREDRRLHAATRPGLDPDAALVITTSPTGSAVVAELLDRDDPVVRDLRSRVVCTTEKEYRGWCMRHPDDAHRLHVNRWSWIKTRVPSQRHDEFRRHPLRDGEVYWLHRAGTAGAGAADGRAAHLWKFDGRHAALLEAFVVEGRAAPPGA